MHIVNWSHIQRRMLGIVLVNDPPLVELIFECWKWCIIFVIKEGVMPLGGKEQPKAG